MVKRNISALVLLLVGGGAAIAVHSCSSAQATGARRWEYCAITEIGTRSHSSDDPEIEAFAVITYFGTSNSRIEEVVGWETSGDPAFNRIQTATYKAIAKLGTEGWEVVGNQNINLGFGGERVSGLFFKRPLEQY